MECKERYAHGKSEIKLEPSKDGAPKTCLKFEHSDLNQDHILSILGFCRVVK